MKQNASIRLCGILWVTFHFLLSGLYQINVVSVDGDVPTTFVVWEHYSPKYFEKESLNNKDRKQHEFQNSQFSFSSELWISAALH